MCETRRKKHLEANWKDGSYITLGERSGSRSVGVIGFMVSSEWSSKVIECTLHSSRTGTLLISISNSRSCTGGKLIGKFCLGDRNDRGETLATFAETNHLAVANSF